MLFQDELRAATRTELGRKWGPVGHRPLSPVRIGYENVYLYLALCPFTGQGYAAFLLNIDELYGEIPPDLACSVSEKADIELIKVNCELDELWSFVGWKANKQWVWVAIDRASRQVVALFVGDRSADGALGLWQSLPERYRAQATFHTDDWRAYKQIIPPEQHRSSKQKKETNHAEPHRRTGFFCTLRQRCSRLVRLSLSFSKKLARHINSIKFVVTNYNLSLQV